MPTRLKPVNDSFSKVQWNKCFYNKNITIHYVQLILLIYHLIYERNFNETLQDWYVARMLANTTRFFTAEWFLAEL
jgi:hypothetical protein